MKAFAFILAVCLIANGICLSLNQAQANNRVANKKHKKRSQQLQIHIQ